MEELVEHKIENGKKYQANSSAFRQLERTLNTIESYDEPELEEYSNRAEELHNKMVDEMTKTFG
jgi:hypothetical protein